MRLKRLEISGFKTFRDKVVFDFPEGVSAVVGPNGSGKSNVVDAIRWAMGEQRIKSLRGKKMEDVIFHGSEAAPGAGMAEVALTLTNHNGAFPPPYVEMQEVSVTRRLFRDCESDYYINNAPCRLLDVREFFMGTGMGGRTYAIIEQNSIAGIIEAKPEEIRNFLEEAAGISKYRSRKEAATRKLEAATANVARLHDVLRELKSQLNHLSRQAKKAQAFKDAREELKSAQLSLALQKCWELEEKKKVLLSRSAAVATTILQLTTAQESQEAKIAALKIELLEEGELLTASQEKLYGIKNTLNIGEQKISFNEQRMAENLARKEAALQELATLNEKIAATSKALAASADAAQTDNEGLARSVEATASAATLVAQLQAQEAEFYAAIEGIKAKHMGAVTAKMNHRNVAASVAKTLEDLAKREKRGAEDLAVMRDNRQKALEARISALTRREELARERDTAAGRLRETTAERARIREEIATTEELLNEQRAQLSQKVSRYDALMEFQRGYTWCSPGAQALLAAAGESVPASLQRSIVGTIAEHIDVAPGFEAAIEALLGEHLGAVVVSSWESGVAAIEHIKNSAWERSRVVAVEARGKKSAKDIAGIKRALEVVRPDTTCRELVEWLLHDAYIVADLSEGARLWQEHGGGNFVTLSGDLLGAYGVITGGARPQGETSLFKNKRELAELAQEKERLAAAVALAEDERRRGLATVAQLEDEETTARQEVHRLTTAGEIATREAEHRGKEAEMLQQRLEVLVRDAEGIQEESLTARKNLAAAQAGEAENALKESGLRDELAEAQQRLDAVRREVAIAQENLTTQKVAAARLQADMRAREAAVKMLQTTLAELQSTLAARVATVEKSDAEVARLEAAREEELLHIQTLMAQLTQAEAEWNRLKEQCITKERELNEAASALRELSQKRESAQREQNERQTEYETTTYQHGSIIQSLEEKGYEDVAAARESFPGLPQAEIARLGEVVEKRKREVENFGEVNLLALSEYEEVKTRHDSLVEQETDIHNAIQTLQRAIMRINNITRRRFAETFAAINTQFQQIFPRLFPGGKGQLSLTNAEDLLETGVDVEIQVPAKKTQTLSLLSGGEKALAAIALILSLVFYKPSSFLILDEVDAALDETNILLFNNILRDVSALSQVLLITHNRGTMEFAQSLYGISMPQDGISTSISVSLNR